MTESRQSLLGAQSAHGGSERTAEAGPGNRLDSASHTTIVFRSERIEYYFGRHPIEDIKEELFKRYQQFRESAQQPAAEEAKEGQVHDEDDEDLMDTSIRHTDRYLGSRHSSQSDKDGKGADETKYTEFAKKQFLLMRVRIKQLSPYICENADLDSLSFESIQKRQLIAPVDVTVSHQKFLQVEQPSLLSEDASHLNIPARFRTSHLNEIRVPKTLCKLTFSDLLIL